MRHAAFIVAIPLYVGVCLLVMRGYFQGLVRLCLWMRKGTWLRVLTYLWLLAVIPIYGAFAIFFPAWFAEWSGVFGDTVLNRSILIGFGLAVFVVIAWRAYRGNDGRAAAIALQDSGIN